LGRLIALSGFMGSGKTSLGRAIAEGLGWCFVDLDEAIERTSGMSISALFSSSGEEEFRRLEQEVLRRELDLARERPDEGTVLALGGGTLCAAGAVASIRSRGTIVLLDVGVDEAWERVRDSGRPLAVSRERFAALKAGRDERYRTSADLSVRVGGRTPEDIVAEVIGMVGS
jgi:shikimate kinase